MGIPRYRIPQRRKPAPPAVSTMRKATLRAARLTEAEIHDIMKSVHHCARQLREGVASELHVEVLRTTMLLARAIEDLGVVRGMAGHIDAAVVALSAIRDRAMETGAWLPANLRLHELDAIACMVDLHDHQLRQVSAAELQRATKRVIAQQQSQGGGNVMHVPAEALGMEVSP